MKRFFSKNGIWLLAGVAVIVVVLCIISAVSSGTPLLRNIAGVIASPFRAAGRRDRLVQRRGRPL